MAETLGGSGRDLASSARPEDIIVRALHHDYRGRLAAPSPHRLAGARSGTPAIWRGPEPGSAAYTPENQSYAATALLAASAQPAAMASTRKRRYIVSSLELEEGHATRANAGLGGYFH